MTDGPGSNVAGVVGAGLTIVGGLAVAKIAMDMTKEMGKQARSTQKRKVARVKRSPDRIQNSLNKMLGY